MSWLLAPLSVCLPPCMDPGPPSSDIFTDVHRRGKELGPKDVGSSSLVVSFWTVPNS